MGDVWYQWEKIMNVPDLLQSNLWSQWPGPQLANLIASDQWMHIHCCYFFHWYHKLFMHSFVFQLVLLDSDPFVDDYFRYWHFTEGVQASPHHSITQPIPIKFLIDQVLDCLPIVCPAVIIQIKRNIYFHSANLWSSFCPIKLLMSPCCLCNLSRWIWLSQP